MLQNATENDNLEHECHPDPSATTCMWGLLGASGPSTIQRHSHAEHRDASEGDDGGTDEDLVREVQAGRGDRHSPEQRLA